MMATPANKYAIGEAYGNYIILGNASPKRYTVKCVNCGRTHEKTRNALYQAKFQNGRSCAKCNPAWIRAARAGYKTKSAQISEIDKLAFSVRWNNRTTNQ